MMAVDDVSAMMMLVIGVLATGVDVVISHRESIVDWSIWQLTGGV